MTVVTVTGNLAVLRLCLCGVALGARRGRWRARVSLVTVAARLVPGGGCRLLLLVASGARRQLSAAVWLMTAGALGVTVVDLRALARMTGVAAGHRQLRLVRQAAVAGLAGLMTRRMRRAGNLRGVALLARSMVGRIAHEVVRRMTPLALDARVKGRFLARRLVARAAVGGARQPMLEGRVRIVTANARPDDAVLRVVRLLARMATLAGLLRAAAHVVRVVTAGALLVRRHLRLRQHDHVLVAPSTSCRLRLVEIVRPMTADAF